MTAHCPSCGYNLKAEKPVSVGPMFYDPRGEVRFHGQRVKLTPSEHVVLGTLVSEVGRFISADVLMNRLGTEAEGNVVDVHLCHIRRKLRAIDPASDHIESQWRAWRWVERAQTT